MTSVFTENRANMFEAIHARLEFSDKLIGGCPKDPKLVQGWLRKNIGIDDEMEILERTRTHLSEMGVEVAASATFEEIVQASESLAGEIKTQGFKRDDDGRPFIESRQIKAGIKESVNILFAKEKWGKTGKGPRGFTAERVFVKPDKIVVGYEVSGVELFVGHLTGPNGPRSTIGYAEYVEQPCIDLFLLSLKGALNTDKWAAIWTHMELNGLGAMRSQGFGQFEVVEFEAVDVADVPTDGALALA